jgi:hypothetical protein
MNDVLSLPDMDTGQDAPPRERQELQLFQAAEMLLEECRMVLPGIQGLFGFQLIAVFSEQFHDLLSRGEQELHLLAIALVGVSIAMVMAPAAIHRQLNPCEVTREFVQLGTRLVLWSLLPLALALCLDFYLVSRVITGSTAVVAFALGLGLVFVLLWWALPRWMRRRLRRRQTPSATSGTGRI